METKIKPFSSLNSREKFHIFFINANFYYGLNSKNSAENARIVRRKFSLHVEARQIQTTSFLPFTCQFSHYPIIRLQSHQILHERFSFSNVNWVSYFPNSYVHNVIFRSYFTLFHNVRRDRHSFSKFTLSVMWYYTSWNGSQAIQTWLLRKHFPS